MRHNPPQYITDVKGKKIFVVLPMKDYNRMVEELEEYADIRMYDEVKAKKEESIPFEEYLKKHKRASMRRYTISISKTAEKQLDKLSDSTAAPIIDAISSLSNNAAKRLQKIKRKFTVIVSGKEISV